MYARVVEPVFRCQFRLVDDVPRGEDRRCIAGKGIANSSYILQITNNDARADFVCNFLPWPRVLV